ncbi:thioredoxin, mitochondrial-like [Haliotis cracherodii]|uniref:Thioredoxin 2 n=1 Tax=Haliotis discus discus TaxID=91233 RepID=B6RB32_HALDI|nr:thioredoxin 2 [Haliotis discus discus]QNT38240.1 thioredoxin 2 [Haliotis discus hannai]
MSSVCMQGFNSMMASRQLLRRLVPMVTSSVRCHHCLRLPQPMLSCQSHVTKMTTPPVRSLAASAKFECINIQDEDDFQQRVLDSKTPVVIDFHATWCGPCKLLAPRLESIIAGKAGKVILAKVDIDDNADLAMRFGVNSVPTVVGIRNGQPLGKFIGLQEDDIIDTFVEKLIN